MMAALCALMLVSPGSTPHARVEARQLARLAEIAWRDGEAKQFPVATSEVFGYGSRQLPYRVLVVKTGDDDRHEVLVVSLDDGTHALHLARRLPNDIWIVRSTLAGEFAKGFHRMYPKGPPVEMDAADGQRILDQEEAFWLDWLGKNAALLGEH
jgi:hypothetical protein